MREFYWRGAVLVLGALLAAGCDAAASTLVVGVRSDFVAGLEAGEIRVRVARLSGGASLDSGSRTLDTSDDLVAGVTVTELAVPRGELMVVGELIGADGATLGTRTAALTVGARSSTVTLIFTRSCRAVVCPASGAPEASECVGGRCVSPACTPETPEACPPALCSADGECPDEGPACTAPVCIAGSCGTRADSAVCSAGATCHPVDGCVGDAPDAGASDAGAATVSLVGSFADCPRTPPYCLTRNGGALTVIDPTDGSRCVGPNVRFADGHGPMGGGLSVTELALVGDAVHYCGMDGTGVSWVLRVDMASDTVSAIELRSSESCVALFDFGPTGLGVARDLTWGTFPTWEALAAGLPVGELGEPLGMCDSPAGELRWEVHEGVRYGSWFNDGELGTCELASGVTGSLPLDGFDTWIEGFDVGDEIVLLSRGELVFFDTAGAELRRVALEGTWDAAQGLECVF